MLFRSFEGSVQVHGFDVKTQGKDVRFTIGYVPQEIRLHLDQTVWETASFYARLKRVSTSRVSKLISEWGLDESKKKPVQNLSGGMKQKLVLVIALLSDPPILFFDEPTSNLDIGARNEFNAALERLKQDGKTLIFCSHRFSEIRKIADRVLVLEAGKNRMDEVPEKIGNQLSDEIVLKLIVDDCHCERGANYLKSKGLSVQKNQTQLWVRISSERKMEPIQLLAQASIPVIDFEIEPVLLNAKVSA